MTEETTSVDSQPEELVQSVNILNLTVVSLKNFIFMVKAISDNKLWPDVEKHLNSRGCDSLVLSAEAILEIREMLLQRKASNTRSANDQSTHSTNSRDGMPTRPDRRLDMFLVCACGTPPPQYPPRPPDDWPEGPWDPPHMQEA